MKYTAILSTLTTAILLASSLVLPASADVMIEPIEVERAQKLENTKILPTSSSREYQSFSSCDEFEDVV
jgi:hypothetical protein